MIPPTLPAAGPGRRAERALWEAFHAGLDDEWFVYHSLDILDGALAREGEIDFLLVHRDHGLLVVECKGEGVHRTSQGRWVRKQPDGRDQEMQSPFGQAQGQVKALVHELQARMRGSFPERFPFVHGHAVAFPLARIVDGGLPLDAQREIVLLADDLRDVGAWVQRALSFWRKAASQAPPQLSPADFTRFRRQVLHPQLRLVETLGARMRVEAEAIRRLSDEQMRVLRGCLSNRRLRVSGGAGTGKTVLALEAARRLATPGRRVLFVCFNKALAAHVREVLEPEVGDGIEATTFHELCRQAALALGQPFEPPRGGGDDVPRFWDEQAPAALLDALAVGKAPRFDAVVIDEAQDFHEDWSVVLEQCLVDTKNGSLLVFYDPGQRIFGRKSGLSDAPAAFSLTVNFRNTRAITEIVRELGGVEMEPHERAPEGEPPVVFPLESRARAQERLDELVQRLLSKNDVQPEQIVVLTPHTRDHSSLAGMTSVGGVPLASGLDDRQGRVLHSTIGAFKGLEADIVILGDIDPTDVRCDRKARYVAASRAKHALYVFAKGDWRG